MIVAHKEQRLNDHDLVVLLLLDLHVGGERLEVGFEHVERFLLALRAALAQNADLSLIHIFRMLEDLTGVNARTIPLDDPDTMSIFTSSKVLGFENDDLLGPTGAVAIPEFNTRFTRQMLIDTQPKDFNTLVRLSGFSHGTDVWLGNARELIVSGTASVLETVGCRDDIMLYLISMGLDPKMSFKIMEAVRKGKVKKGGFQDGWVEAMQEHDVPEWYIESLAKIGYLFPKAHAVAYVMMAVSYTHLDVYKRQAGLRADAGGDPRGGSRGAQSGPRAHPISKFHKELFHVYHRCHFDLRRAHCRA